MLEPKFGAMSRSAKFLPLSQCVRIFTAGHRCSEKEKCGVNQSSHLLVAYCCLDPLEMEHQLTYAGADRVRISAESHANLVFLRSSTGAQGGEQLFILGFSHLA